MSAKKKKIKTKDARPFAEKHPKLNMLLGLAILAVTAVGICYFVWSIISWLLDIFEKSVALLKTIATTMDAVVIVALITGAVSITGVIISSVIAKAIDYRKSRQEYLAQKREKPYGEFVDMVYKIQQNTKKPGTYTEQQMLLDLEKFSKEITLWGSSKVVNRWVSFRENGAKPDAGNKNLFLLEGIMNEMRKDLGLKKAKKGNLLAFFINDIKTAMKTTNK